MELCRTNQDDLVGCVGSRTTHKYQPSHKNQQRVAYQSMETNANSMPISISNCKVDKFKLSLDMYPNIILDQPRIPGYTKRCQTESYYILHMGILADGTAQPPSVVGSEGGVTDLARVFQALTKLN